MALYRLVFGFLRLVNYLYFVEVRSVGRENVPEEGPVLLAANHPSSILDTVLISTQISRPIRYLAKSGLFRSFVLAFFFKQMGAIPVYRAGESTDARTRNEGVFRKVYELFDEGGCLGIFPEGKNSPRAQVGDIRSGAARMALGAEERRDFKAGLKIVPVGINFEDRELLTSAVLLRFGEPISVAEYEEVYRENPNRGVQQLTHDIQSGLRMQAMHIEDYKVAELASDLADVFRVENAPSDSGDDVDPPSTFSRWLWTLLGWYGRSSEESGRAFERRMDNKREIVEGLDRAAKSDEEGVERLRARVDRYKDHLKQIQLTELLSHSLEEPIRERLIRVRMTLYAVLMAPVALFGFVHNALPYIVTKATARLSSDEAVRGFTYFALGLLTFGATYAILGTWLWRFTDMSLMATIIYIALLPPTGFAALSYRRNVLLYRDKILIRAVFWNNRRLVELLREERDQIIQMYRELAGDAQ